MEKPKKLYRGLHLNLDDFEKFDLGGDLISPYEPVIDSEGRQRLSSGNEYGVYMTDNKHMALDIYGNVHNGGICINNNLVIGPYCEKLVIPAIGIVYEIDTTNLDVRKPWISKEFESSYNSNYEGDEYIADLVPAANCRIIRILIGSDVLHDKELVEVDEDLDRLKERILNVINIRRLHLLILEKELLKQSPLYVRKLMFNDLELYKELFGYNGIKYIDVNNISSIDIMHGDIIKYLLFIYYQKNPDTIDYKTLKYILLLKKKISTLADEDKIEGLVQLIVRELDLVNENRDKFICTKRSEEKEVNTRGFDQKIEMLTDILLNIQDAIKKINEEKQSTFNHKII